MSEQKLNEIAQRIWELYSLSKPRLRARYNNKLAMLSAVESVEKERIIHFNFFDDLHSEYAHAIYQQFIKIANKGSTVEVGLNDALDYFEHLLTEKNPDLLYHALDLFITHGIKDVQFKKPSILTTDPTSLIPSRTGVPKLKFEVALGSEDETKIDWFREDPLLNEHHGHWHVVYNRSIQKDRQGEMFFYMHRQMLARYDAERYAEDMPLVRAFDDMRKPIEVGYVIGNDERLDNRNTRTRAPGVAVSQDNATTQLELLRVLRQDLTTTTYIPNNNSHSEEIKAVNLLGSTIESNTQALDRSYQNYHGRGHGYIASLNVGVMNWTETAIRDVVFWEWHKGVDDILELLIEQLPAYNKFIDAPKVTFRKTFLNRRLDSPDIILCKTTPHLDALTDASGRQFANNVFGGDQWGTNFSNGSFAYTDEHGTIQTITTTNELKTWFEEGAITYRENGQSFVYRYNYLMHDPFCYFVRVQNDTAEFKQVTVRIFLAVLAFVEDHRQWIEMDKFLYTLPPDSKHIIFRKDVEASVIRKPAVKNPSQENVDFDPLTMRMGDRRCECGWPYHLLLPRSKPRSGTEHILMVMITDADIDLMGTEPNCGSLSFCGATEEQYPDTRPLGYPFNRSYQGSNQPISEAIMTNPHMAARIITITNER